MDFELAMAFLEVDRDLLKSEHGPVPADAPGIPVHS